MKVYIIDMLTGQQVFIVQTHDQKRIQGINNGGTPSIKIVIRLFRDRRNFVRAPCIVFVSLPGTNKRILHQLASTLKYTVTRCVMFFS